MIKQKVQIDGGQFLLLCVFGALLTAAHGMWINHGGGLLNHRSVLGDQDTITASSVANLGLKWRFKTGFDVSATPSVAGRSLYFPGWDGNLYALNARTGDLLWKENLTRIIGRQTRSRTTPVVYKHLLLVGLYGPSIVLAFNRYNGSLVWQTQPLDSTLFSVITMSGAPYEGFYYVGVSSIEEFVTTCCTFQGSFQKIRIKDGHVMWKTPMVPPNSGFYGVAVWGSSPPIDVKRRMIFIGTGNTYEVPDSVEKCELNRPNNSRQHVPDPCRTKDVYEDSILAISIDDGSVLWSKQFESYDVWTLPCSTSASTPNCPAILGPDYDFGEAPMLLDLSEEMSNSHISGSANKCVVIAGQKSGVVWALECETGEVVWSTMAGPGGSAGGASWGSSTDGERVFTNIINNEARNFTLLPSKEVTQGGGWVAMEVRTGRVLWATGAPGGAHAFGPLSAASGVVFAAGSSSEQGILYALNASSGAILWQQATGATIYGGFSISRKCIFGGNGYATNIPIGNRGTFVSAFCLPSHSSPAHSVTLT